MSYSIFILRRAQGELRKLVGQSYERVKEAIGKLSEFGNTKHLEGIY